MIYFDNAATTAIKPESVGKTMSDVLTSGHFGNPGRDSSNYSVNSSLLVEQTREKIAQLFNVPSSDFVMFTSNATDSLNTTLKGLLKPGDHVISTNYEHNSVIRPLEQLRRNNVDIDYVPFDTETGVINIEDFETRIKSNTKAIVCTYASNVTGYVLPIDNIGKLCKKYNLLFIVDAAQSAGFIDIDIQKQGIDVLCFTGHKSLYGPQGTGGICLKESLPIEPLKSGGTGIDSFNSNMPDEFPTRLEAGTMNVPGIAGLYEGIDYILKYGLNNIRQYVIGLTDEAIDGLDKYPEVKIYTPRTGLRTGVIAFNVGDLNSAEVGQWLWDEYQIANRTGAHCAPKVLESFNLVEQGIVRLSFSSFNTSEEIKVFLGAMEELIIEYRKEI